MPTPYDNGIALWHWKGDAVGETTIDQLAQMIKRWAPAVTDLIVKTCDGAVWQGQYDKSAPLRISGPDRIDQWTETLQKYGLGFHAWVVVKGLDISAEADKIIQTCAVLGVKSLILDVEPYSGYFRGGKDSIRPLMAAVRAAIPGNFHIGLSIDPRPQHYHVIFPDEWFPYVQSVHPQIYWAAFQQSPEDVLDAAFSTWSGFGHPIYPALQGNTDIDSMNRARTLALSKYKVQGLSWWQLGAIGPAQWPGINVAIDGSVPSPAGGDQGTGHFGRKIIVAPDGPGYEDGTIEIKSDSKSASLLLRAFSNAENGPIKYKATCSDTSTVWARWDPQIDQSGWYEIAAFVPGQHASTANARYRIHHGNSAQTDAEIPIAQVHYVDSWVPLGVFNVDADDPTAGIVQLNDLTGETGKEIAFGAVRWRQVLGIEPREPYLADGFDAPIGTLEERRSPEMWPSKWIDATGYAIRYRIGTPQEAYHTGADLNLNAPYYDADAHSPVYAAASGVVTYVGRIIGWGKTIIIRHDPLIGTGQVIYTRSSHVELPRVQQGQRVTRGEQIANVGNADGAYPYHLHFDVSTTTILDVQPGNWPGLDLNNLLSNYADPRLFVAQHRPRE